MKTLPKIQKASRLSNIKTLSKTNESIKNKKQRRNKPTRTNYQSST
jgi:hypothetical protein